MSRVDWTESIAVDDGSMFIGWDDGQPGQYFAGRIAEVRLWDHARREQDIKADMKHHLLGNEPGLLGYWPLRGDATDKIINGNRHHDGEINGAIYQSGADTSGGFKPGGPIHFQPTFTFEGTHDYIEVANAPNPTDKMTISCWAKSDTPTWNKQYCLISKRNAFMFGSHAGTKKMHFMIFSAGAWRSVMTENVPGDITKWHHYAGTFSGDVLRLYIDGEEMQKVDWASPIADDDGSMFIGWDDGQTEQYFAGRVAEVRLWDRDRSQEEIKKDMNKHLVGNEPGLLGYWPLRGDATDKTSNGHDGEINGAFYR